MNVSRAQRYRVEKDENGVRLDRFVSSRLPGVSRSRVSYFVKQGYVSINGQVIKKPAAPVKAGDVVDVVVPDENRNEYPPAVALPVQVLFEDRWLLVVNKPAGILVHPVPGVNREPTLLNAVIHKIRGFSGNEARRPGIVHRLDRPVSGAVVFAKKPEIAVALRELFASREVEKIYWAFVWGVPERKEFLISAPLGPHPHRRRKITVVEKGRVALTRVEVIKEREHVSLLKLQILTGRKHQIRAHLEYAGHPIVNDREYGFKPSMLDKCAAVIRNAAGEYPGIFLHARQISFKHPVTDKKICVSAPFRGHFARILEFYGIEENHIS